VDAFPAAALAVAGGLEGDGLRIAQACLEAHGCVVDVAESGNDHDTRRGFIVDFARADERAGAAVARIQVECARRRVPCGDWTLRVIPADRRYWSAMARVVASVVQNGLHPREWDMTRTQLVDGGAAASRPAAVVAQRRLEGEPPERRDDGPSRGGR
jgi:hypothetical protein